MKDIKPILRTLGLLESEIHTYLRALEYGPSTVLELTKLTGLSRQATYVAIQSLQSRGLMSSALHDKKRRYAAEHPEKLLVYAERRQAELREYADDLKRALPELELQVGGDKPMVKVFEGKEGINAIMADIQTTRHKVAEEITDVDAMFAVIDKTALRPMRTQLKKFDTKVRGLYAGVTHPSEVKTERYTLPKELSGFKANVGIYGNKIALVTFEGKMHSIVIESAALTKTLHILFELAFETAAKKFK